MEVRTNPTLDELFRGWWNGAAAIQLVSHHQNAQNGPKRKDHQKSYREFFLKLNLLIRGRQPRALCFLLTPRQIGVVG